MKSLLPILVAMLLVVLVGCRTENDLLWIDGNDTNVIDMASLTNVVWTSSCVVISPDVEFYALSNIVYVTIGDSA